MTLFSHKKQQATIHERSIMTQLIPHKTGLLAACWLYSTVRRTKDCNGDYLSYRYDSHTTRIVAASSLLCAAAVRVSKQKRYWHQSWSCCQTVQQLQKRDCWRMSQNFADPRTNRAYNAGSFPTAQRACVHTGSAGLVTMLPAKLWKSSKIQTGNHIQKKLSFRVTVVVCRKQFCVARQTLVLGAVHKLFYTSCITAKNNDIRLITTFV